MKRTPSSSSTRRGDIAGTPRASGTAPQPLIPHTHSAQGIRCVIDPKSIMFLYGLKLDYSDALIGGGFSFHNPNADSTCGCGTSFSV